MMSSRSVRSSPPFSDCCAFTCRSRNANHLTTAAGAENAVRLDDLLDTRQIFGQIAKIAFGLGCLFAWRIVLFQASLLFLGLGNRHLKVFKSELALVGGQLFGPLTVKGVAHFFDQLFQSRIGLADRRDLCL